MPKTQLTLDIQESLGRYYPTNLSDYKLNKFRDSFGCPEVLVSNSDVRGGIVDYMRFDEYEVNNGSYKGCSVGNSNFNFIFDDSIEGGRVCKRNFKNWREASFKECNEDCVVCKNINQIEYEPLFTCFEIKVTKEDFHSNHGHNFVGNLNYYVMPTDLYKKVKDEIPNDIGVITVSRYIDSEGEHLNNCRQVKKATFKDLYSEERFERLLCLTKALMSRRGDKMNIENIEWS